MHKLSRWSPHLLFHFCYRLALSIILSLFLTACGRDNEDIINHPIFTTTLRGTVATGRAAGAAVAAYAVNSDGTMVPAGTAQTITDNNGRFTLRLPHTSGLFIVQATGGHYIEEATAEKTTLAASLSAPVMLPTVGTLSVTPFTTAAVHYAQGQAGGINSANLHTAITNLTSYLGFNPVTTLPISQQASQVQSSPTIENTYAFALGVESQYRTANQLTLPQVTQQILADIDQSKTLYNSGGGGTQVIVQSDGTAQTVQNINLSSTTTGGLAAAANDYIINPSNTSGVLSISDAMAATQPHEALPIATTSDACLNREAILAQYASTFTARANKRQAALKLPAVTETNWNTTTQAGSWGPIATNYPAFIPPEACADTVKWQQEFLMAAINYWVDQNLNYCHHHIPGWTPPISFRNSSAGSTSGSGVTSAMTCTPHRFADGRQVVTSPSSAGTTACHASSNSNYCNSPNEIDSPNPAERVQWNGYDCSNFSAWYYNFSGISAGEMPTGIGSQACTQAIGVLLDINASNLEQYKQYLQAGDLLYILGSTNSQQISHVVTWSAQQWSDLQNTSNASVLYNFNTRGQANNRLGGDLTNYGLTNATQFKVTNPWMIIDSHYAGAAYRPFSGWYRSNLSHIRRIINAKAVKTHPVLKNLVINTYPASSSNIPATVDGPNTSFRQVMYSSLYANQPAAHGYRLVANIQRNQCARDGNIANLTHTN